VHTIKLMLINYLTNSIARSYASKLNVQVMTIQKQKIVRIFFQKKKKFTRSARKPMWHAVAWSDRVPRRPPAPPRGVFFFIFFFSSFLLLTNFLIHKLGAQLILWNKLCTQLDIYRKSYAHNLSLKKKIYAQVILRVVVHISCTHKFCASQTYA
jgi:hypothetical protein